MGEKEPGHGSCSEHISIKLWSTSSTERIFFNERPVVDAFLLVELGHFKATMKIAFAYL